MILISQVITVKLFHQWGECVILITYISRTCESMKTWLFNLVLTWWYSRWMTKFPISLNCPFWNWNNLNALEHYFTSFFNIIALQCTSGDVSEISIHNGSSSRNDLLEYNARTSSMITRLSSKSSVNCR